MFSVRMETHDFLGCVLAAGSKQDFGWLVCCPLMGTKRFSSCLIPVGRSSRPGGSPSFCAATKKAAEPAVCGTAACPSGGWREPRTSQAQQTPEGPPFAVSAGANTHRAFYWPPVRARNFLTALFSTSPMPVRAGNARRFRKSPSELPAQQRAGSGACLSGRSGRVLRRRPMRGEVL